MNVLIAGGAGFIGSNLCDELVKDNNIIVVDKLIFGDKNIKHLINNDELNHSGRFKFYNTDLSNYEETRKVFSENSINIVYHLAANSDIQKSAGDPSIDFNDTFMTTRNILECMRNNGIKNLFFASTSAVYGEMVDKKLNENTGGLKPVSFYGGAKFASEAFISSYAYMCDMSVVTFRFPNVVGPRLTHGAVFDFIKKLQMNSSELEILGDGTQCKPYIYVKDLVEAIVKLTKNMNKGTEIYNLSVNSEGTTVTRIAEIVVEEMKLTNVKFNYTGGDRGWKGDVPRFSYDISKILSTGWMPKHTSDEAIRQTVRDILSA